MSGAEDKVAGWDAIDAALKAVYGAQEPKHFGTIMKWRLGGPDPLDGVSVYASASFGVPHWHYVSYGLTELYEKESEHAEVSGWGFELTFRLRRPQGEAADADPPIWPINLMQNLARYVFDSGATLDPGDHMDANGPIMRDSDTALSALLFVEDPELPKQATPHGAMQFVQIVGVTPEELASAQSWNTRGMLALLAKAHPGFVVDLGRSTITNDAATRAAIAAGIHDEGSSMGVAFGDVLVLDQEGSRLGITVGSIVADRLVTVLPGRLRFGRPLILVGKSGEARTSLELVPGDAYAFAEASGDARPKLTLSPALVDAFVASVKGPGRYELSPELSVTVVDTPIRG